MQDAIENVDAKDMVDRLLNDPLMKLTINQKDVIASVQANVSTPNNDRQFCFRSH